MILRVLRAHTKPDMRGAFERLCREKSVPHIRRTPGFVALQILKPLPNRPDDFVLISTWKDLDALRGFAGERWEEVVLLPGEADLVESLSVEHYDDALGSIGMPWQISEADLKAREDTAVKAVGLSDAQWAQLQSLLPTKNREGRPRADDRRTLEGILYVLRAGCRWQDLPREYGSSVTCWRRLAQWQANGTWERLWRAFFSTLDTAEKMTWAQAFLGGTLVPYKQGARKALELTERVEA